MPVVSDECVAFLRRQAMELDLPIHIYELEAGKPIVIITWLGEEPGLPSILLNSHMDVVPVYDVGLFLCHCQDSVARYLRILHYSNVSILIAEAKELHATCLPTSVIFLRKKTSTDGVPST